MSRTPQTPGEIEEVRNELQRLGYLSHRVERYLLQDALRPERPLLTVTLLAAKVGLFGGALLALGGALLLAAWNEPVLDSPFDLPLLLLHLLLPATVGFGGAFLVLAGLLAAVLRLRPGLRIDALSLAVGVAGGGALAGVLLWRGRELLAPLPWSRATLLAAGGAAAAYLLARVLYHGLLALAIRLTDRAPRRRLALGAFLLPAAAALALALLVLPAALAARRGSVPSPAVLPAAAGERVLVIGLDGVLPGELDYLLARGALPTLSRLAKEGTRARYARGDEPPAAFWTTLATGLPSAAHGVAAVDAFRPAGMASALGVNGPFRWYWAEVAVPLRLASQRPLLATRRRAWALWELVARGGAPVVAINWWSTYPATALPGLVVAHGAYQLLGEGGDGAAGAVAPALRQPELVALRAQAAASLAAGGGDDAGAPPDSVAVARAALGERAATWLAQQALLPDEVYRRLLRGEANRAPHVAFLYLPALDLAAAGWAGGEVAFGDLLHAEMAAADRLLGELTASGEWGTVLVVVDPGRRDAGEGRALLWRRSGCAGAAEVQPAELAAALFRAAGLAQSAELPPPPASCRWAPPPARVPSYGQPPGEQGEPARGDEYLHSLQSLGYV